MVFEQGQIDEGFVGSSVVMGDYSDKVEFQLMGREKKCSTDRVTDDRVSDLGLGQ